MFHDEFWKPVYLGVKRSEVKVTSQSQKQCLRGSLHSCECWLLICLVVSLQRSLNNSVYRNGSIVDFQNWRSLVLLILCILVHCEFSAPLKLRPYGAIQMCILLLLLFFQPCRRCSIFCRSGSVNSATNETSSTSLPTRFQLSRTSPT